MQTMRVEGRAAVTALLRKMADEIDTGVLVVGDGRISCPPELAAVVNPPDPGSDHLLLVSLRFEHTDGGARHLALESELAHPGD